MKNTLLFLVTLISSASFSSASTTIVSANIYAVNEAVSFSISNAGASNYLFSWTDSSGTFTDISDPTFILTSGETYNFQRTTGSHPFVITDDTLPVNGTDGSYSRATSSGTVIDNATLNPIADFRAEPAPTTDQISWATADSGNGTYYYTCRVTGHTGMTGRIQVVPEPSSSLLSVIGLSALLIRRKR